MVAADHVELAFQLENLQSDEQIEYYYSEDGKPRDNEQKN